jgi:hypothetical protein
MKRSTKKLISILCVAFFILSIAVPAFAASNNSVDAIKKVAKDAEYKLADLAVAPILRIEEKNVLEFSTDTANQEVFRLTLDNAKWDASETDIQSAVNIKTAPGVGAANGVEAVTVKRLSDQTIQVSFFCTNPSPDRTTKAVLYIPLLTEVTGSGDVTVEIDSRDSRVSGQKFTYAIAGAKETIATIDKVKSFADSVVIGTIEIDELIVGSLDGETEIKFRLPKGFEWKDVGTATPVSLGGTLTRGVSGRDLTFTSAVPGLTKGAVRGSILFENLEIVATSDAKFGDIDISISGAKVKDQDLTVAKYVDYGVTVKADGDPKELLAGRWDSSATDEVIASGDTHKLQKLVIEEAVFGGWMANRRTRVEFPEGVKIVGVTESGLKGFKSKEFEKTGTKISDVSGLGKNYVEYNGISRDGTGDKAKVELTFFVSVSANFNEDIVATVTGTGIANEKYEVTLGKAVAPVALECETADLRIGIKNQPIGDITITEAKKEAILAGTSKNLEIKLGKGINWSGVPTIDVDGDLELRVGSAKCTDDVLSIPVKSESFKPSTIKITNAKVDIDRTVAEGDYSIKVGGSAIVQNSDKNNLDIGYFDQGSVASDSALAVITPAPGETRATSVFTIGGTTYTVMEQNTTVEKTMDVAPYIKDGRTFLPLRYVANALGVNDDNIIWDPVTKAVTIFKGDRIAQVTIGSKTMLVNGVTINMDVAPEIADGRTMLPIRWMGQALGATIDWDAETRSVTVKQ